jgi:hypothetical protein
MAMASGEGIGNVEQRRPTLKEIVMEQLFAWILSFMVAVAPPGRNTYIPEANETKDDAMARYESIAQDVAQVIWDTEEKPLFQGPNGRARTAALILSVMLHESAFRKDVDTGIGKLARGDGGRSWCLMQMNIGSGRTISWNKTKYRFAKDGDPVDEILPSYTGQMLVQDRKNCIRAGLHGIHGTRCGGLPVREWLRAYASGSCEKGSTESRRRMDVAIAWYNNHRPSFTDADILTAMATPPAPAPAPTAPMVLVLPEDLRRAVAETLIPNPWRGATP